MSDRYATNRASTWLLASLDAERALSARLLSASTSDGESVGPTRVTFRRMNRNSRRRPTRSGLGRVIVSGSPSPPPSPAPPNPSPPSPFPPSSETPETPPPPPPPSLPAPVIRVPRAVHLALRVPRERHARLPVLVPERDRGEALVAFGEALAVGEGAGEDAVPRRVEAAARAGARAERVVVGFPQRPGLLRRRLEPVGRHRARHEHEARHAQARRLRDPSQDLERDAAAHRVADDPHVERLGAAGGERAQRGAEALGAEHAGRDRARVVERREHAPLRVAGPEHAHEHAVVG